MLRKSRVFVVAIVFCLCLSMVCIPTQNASAADISLGGVIYNVDGQYIEMAPLTYMQIKGATDDNVKKYVKNTDGSLRALQAIVCTRGYVFAPLTYFQNGKNYAQMGADLQVTNADILNRATATLVSGQVVVTPRVTAPTASAITFGGVAPAISGNTITVTVVPGTSYNTASVTLSQRARVTVASGTSSKTTVFPVGTIDSASLISAITSKTSATGTELIAKSPVTITLQAVDASDINIAGLSTVYTVNFVAQ